MATKKNAALKTTLAGIQAFPAKSAPSKDTPHLTPGKLALAAGGRTEAAKKPTRAKKAVASPVEVAGKALAAASTKPMRAKAATKPARSPAVLAKSGKLLGADPKGVPGAKAKPAAKRVVKDAGSTMTMHELTSVAELAKVCGDYPRGSTFLIAGPHIDIYNLRGKQVASIRQVAKPAKGAKK